MMLDARQVPEVEACPSRSRDSELDISKASAAMSNDV
jgi:hypothetical protein